jgi:hypothetical protein
MTQEEALAAVTTNNTALGGGAATINYGAFALWTNNYTKEYNICLYNTQYNAQFTAATESQKIAFARVSLQTIAVMTTAETVDNFKTKFNIQAAADAELAAYLGL